MFHRFQRGRGRGNLMRGLLDDTLQGNQGWDFDQGLDGGREMEEDPYTDYASYNQDFMENRMNRKRLHGGPEPGRFVRPRYDELFEPIEPEERQSRLQEQEILEMEEERRQIFDMLQQNDMRVIMNQRLPKPHIPRGMREELSHQQGMVGARPSLLGQPPSLIGDAPGLSPSLLGLPSPMQGRGNPRGRGRGTQRPGRGGYINADSNKMGKRQPLLGEHPQQLPFLSEPPQPPNSLLGDYPSSTPIQNFPQGSRLPGASMRGKGPNRSSLLGDFPGQTNNFSHPPSMDDGYPSYLDRHASLMSTRVNNDQSLHFTGEAQFPKQKDPRAGQLQNGGNDMPPPGGRFPSNQGNRRGSRGGNQSNRGGNQGDWCGNQGNRDGDLGNMGDRREHQWSFGDNEGNRGGNRGGSRGGSMGGNRGGNRGGSRGGNQGNRGGSMRGNQGPRGGKRGDNQDNRGSRGSDQGNTNGNRGNRTNNRGGKQGDKGGGKGRNFKQDKKAEEKEQKWLAEQKVAEIRKSLLSPLTALIDSIQQSKVAFDVPALKNALSPHKGIFSEGYYTQHDHPSDPSKRVLKHELYINHIFLHSTEVTISQLVWEDMMCIQSRWAKSKLRKTVQNKTYEEAIGILRCIPAAIICNNHDVLMPGEEPDGYFDLAVSGFGKQGNTNRNRLDMMSTKGKEKNLTQADLVVLLNEEWTLEKNAFSILNKSASTSGLLLEWDFKLVQMRNLNFTRCTLMLQGEHLSEAIGLSRPLAKNNAATVALEKFYQTQPMIKILQQDHSVPKTSWAQLKARAEAWIPPPSTAKAGTEGTGDTCYQDDPMEVDMDPQDDSVLGSDEPLLPCNHRVVQYVTRTLEQRASEDSLIEVFIGYSIPLAERLAINKVAKRLGYRLKSDMKSHKELLLMAVRDLMPKEMLACLRRNNHRSGRYMLVNLGQNFHM